MCLSKNRLGGFVSASIAVVSMNLVYGFAVCFCLVLGFLFLESVGVVF